MRTSWNKGKEIYYIQRDKSLLGKRFGRLVIIDYPVVAKYERAKVLCQCDCGNKIVKSVQDVRRGHTKSCGCFRKEMGLGKAIKNNAEHVNTKHGMSYSKMYKAWVSMLQRCQNPKNTSYGNYGGRGISVCDRWCKFENFYADMGDKPSPRHSLDRVDVNGDYDPGNCRWATTAAQARNKRTNVIISFAGKSMCLLDWVEFLKSINKKQREVITVGS